MVGRGRGHRGFDIDWQLMSLAILNEGRELPPPQQARMRDSQQIGRLMAAIHGERGATAMATAYRAFGERYFEHSAPVDNGLVEHVLHDRGSPRHHRCGALRRVPRRDGPRLASKKPRRSR